MTVYSTTGGWITVSDKREKEDIKDLKTASSLKRILELKPKHYLRKFYETNENPVSDTVKQERHVGFLAQDVLLTNPHCISSWCNDNINKNNNDDGSRFGINYNDYIIHLVGSIQEHNKQLQLLI